MAAVRGRDERSPNGPVRSRRRSTAVAHNVPPAVFDLSENSPPGRVTQGVARDHVHAERSESVLTCLGLFRGNPGYDESPDPGSLTRLTQRARDSTLVHLSARHAMLLESPLLSLVINATLLG